MFRGLRSWRASVAWRAFPALAALALVATATAMPAALAQARTQAVGTIRPTTASLDPTLFSQLSSGVVLVRGFSCSGAAKIEGTGFLVGSGVVMTARHVVDPSGLRHRLACHVKVQVDGHWIKVARITWWYGAADPTGRDTDLATLKLAKPAAFSDYVFDFRNSSPRIGTTLAVLGHPLGNDISLNQGKLIAKGHLHRVPVLAMHLLSAEGASGSPIVDDGGHVVGILQRGLTLRGARTSELAVGIDLASWWRSGNRVERTLCHAYPNGGIPTCEAPKTTPTIDTPEPPPPPTVTLTASPQTVDSGNQSLLTLSSDAWGCDATSWNPGLTPETNGSFSTGPLTATTTFTITCYNSVGVGATASVTVTVNAPAPAPSPPPSPTPTPPPPASWTPPSGFTLWTGPGSYAAGTVAWQFTPCTREYPTSASCWGVNIVSEFGCRDGAFTKVNIYDSNNVIVDTGIDQVSVLPPNQIALTHGDTFDTSAVKFQVSGIDCFDF